MTIPQLTEKLVSMLRKSGQTIGVEDEMIAAICIANNASLLTRNLLHFQRIKKLNVITLNDI
jgi:predicted nucleic acid-binding protein